MKNPNDKETHTMSEASFERHWKKNLTSILEDLSDVQYEKMLECLDIPQSKKRCTRAEMPRVIIQHLGVNGSITAIRDAMDEIPRRDAVVQDLLRPFVERLQNKQQKKKERMKGIHDSDSNESEEEPQPVAGKKRKRESVSNLSEEEQKSTAGHEKSEVVSNSDSTEKSSDEEQTKCQPKKEGKKPWEISIHDLISSGQNETKKVIAAKVVQKSGLRRYETEAKNKKVLFHLAVADETDCIKVVVYGKHKYKEYVEGQCYLFRDVIVDKEWGVFRVTRESTVSKTGTVNIPEDILVRAQTLIYPTAPVCSVADVKGSSQNMPVSVEGVIKQILAAQRVTEKKLKRKDFRLRDGENSILISLWGEHGQQLRGKSEGDTVRVTNVKPNHYYDTTTLNSTSYTKIVTVESAPVQNVSIKIIGVIKVGKLKTHLEAHFSEEVQTFVVASKHLAEAFGIGPEGNFEQQLLEKIPLSAEAEIKGSKINAIRATTNV